MSCKRGFTLIELLIVVAIIAVLAAIAVPSFLEAQARSQADVSWIFVSTPDFVNVDTEYPQKGWEDALGFILEAVRAEKPDFVRWARCDEEGRALTSASSVEPSRPSAPHLAWSLAAMTERGPPLFYNLSPDFVRCAPFGRTKNLGLDNGRLAVHRH